VFSKHQVGSFPDEDELVSALEASA
jgi:hypothetical protein